jgi:hypothetical protein
MIVLLPLSLYADDTGAAMLRSNGGVRVNKNQALSSSALFPNDLIETQTGAMARIEAAGSTADISSDSAVQFEGDELVLDHGRVSVNTSRLLRVRVGCVTVTPVLGEWTHYDVEDKDGKITVSAFKHDVYIDARSSDPKQAKQTERSERATVKETEQKSRTDKCGAGEIKDSGRLAGRGALMNSPWARGAGIVGIGVLTCWALCRGGPPLSPSNP